MKYAAKRIAMLLLTMVIVSFLAFAAFDVISGDPATAMLGTQATAEKVEALREELGLNRPLLIRYGEWLAGFFTGDLGTSYSYRQPVWELIAPQVGVTLCLSALSFLLIVAVSIPLGVRAAGREGGKLDAVSYTHLSPGPGWPVPPPSPAGRIPPGTLLSPCARRGSTPRRPG